MSIQSVVNTNMSSVSDPVGVRGNFPQGVMAFECGPSGTVGTADIQHILATKLVAGTEKIGVYQGTLLEGLTAALGVQQTVTLNFASVHGWTGLTHDIEVKLASDILDTANLDTGHCSGGSFGTTTTLQFVRRAAAVTGSNSILQPCTFQVTVRKRGVAAPAAV
jgi:hypothetical protein